ncbi:SAM-dependent methyltransferase [Saccharopolyspora sp. WRP15-2]|uniref:SAM-dependent methyltransferase n=1 Tax=Saccharopolyspora oryzae TaxID=2997343 RepID=A0ABT4UYP5_9PSEU|nr:SAM-dependent methyltransferase [Saccharopolyspora oryzae]MDA3626688.1 SAM-dependent methyltransferase [Saccharopolyspora oryzae]
MPERSQIPHDLDLDRPSGARVHDFILGGGSNFSSDRELARRILEAAPDVRTDALANRACLHRAVRTCLDLGVRQFLDVGCGIPTLGTSHHTAQQLAPDARVVYVDSEPLAVTQGELLLESNPGAAIVQADLREVDAVLSSERTRRLLDPAEPVAVLMFSVLHFVPEPPSELIRRYLDAFAPGSLLGLTHFTADHAPRAMRAVLDLLSDSQHPGTARSRAELESLLADLDLLEPGVVPTADWRPEPGDSDLRTALPLSYAALARKP